VSGDRYHHLWLFDTFDFATVISVRFTRQYDRFRATCTHLKRRVTLRAQLDGQRWEIDDVGNERYSESERTHSTTTTHISVEQMAGYPNYLCL